MEEKLITPKADKRNGYYIFSNEDIEKLMIIQKLRKADFSINDIRSVMEHPNTAHFYLQKQIELLEKEQDLMNQKIDCLSRLNDQLPVNVGYQDLAETLQTMLFPNKNDNQKKSGKEDDAKLVTLYLWGSFLKDLPMTEYRQYLWEKVLKEMIKSNDSNILTLKKYLYSLPADKLDEGFAKRFEYMQGIIRLTPDDYGTYVNWMKVQVSKLLKSKKHLELWRTTYFSNTLPLTCLFDSPVSELISELSPSYSLYYKNIHTCCQELYLWLYTPEGQTVRSKLFETLEGYMNIEDHHHGELAAFVSIS